MKNKIGNVEYDIMPIPPFLSPYSTRISQLLKSMPNSLEEAEKFSKEIEANMKVLLEGTVSPTPPREHQLQVFNALINLTNKVLEDAKFFRESEGPGGRKSGSTRDYSTQTPKRNLAASRKKSRHLASRS